MAALGVLNNVELVSMVVQWLKQITLEEESVEFGDHGRPKIPTTWTCHFARISTVNRVFFYASIDVLWERLSSVKPLFGCVLPADRDANGMLLRRLSYKKNELTYRHWDRFKLYSAKTKVLIVDDSICMHSAWMSHMMASEDRPRALFPSLRRLYLAATTPLAMCITYNCIPSVHDMELEIELAQVKEKRDNFRAILTGLSQKSCVLTDLRIKRPATFSVIGAISRILSLANLEITVGGTSAEVSGLDNLASLPSLQKLKIDHYHDLMVKVPASTLRGLDLDIDSQYSGSQQTRFTKLRELYVRAPVLPSSSPPPPSSLRSRTGSADPALRISTCCTPGHPAISILDGDEPAVTRNTAKQKRISLYPSLPDKKSEYSTLRTAHSPSPQFNRATPPHLSQPSSSTSGPRSPARRRTMAQTTKTQRLDVPKLLSPVTANSVKSWLDGCDDAYEVHQLLYPDQQVQPQLRILMAGLKMEAPEASQWWSENRESLKALTKWEDFVTKVKERFIPSGWKMEALATFYAVRQKNLPFSEFVAALQSARGILGTAGPNYKIPDSTFKHHLLLFCNPLLSLRVRAIPGLGYDTIKVDSLINLMSSTWNSMVAEGVSRQESVSSGIGRPSGARSGSLPPLTESEKSSLRASGGCFHCRRTPASPGWSAHTSKTCPGDPSRSIAPRNTNVAAMESVTVAAVDAWDDDVEFVRPENPGFGLLDYESSDDEDDIPNTAASAVLVGEDSGNSSDWS